MKSLAAALALFCLANGAAAAQGSGEAEFRVRGKGRQLILTHRGRAHRLDAGERIDAAKLTDVTLLFATRRETFVYLVVDACGPSRLESNDRQCGAGTECNLLWVKLDPVWRIADLSSVRYESCWLPITSTEGSRVSGGNLELEYEDLRQKMSYRVTYSAGQPERGLKVEERPLENAP